ncbi:glycosyltransferase [Conexibacter sp. W3-3-2]|nr:glycosyltransferase [Conexibacter sp. W3-3-2]
MVQDEDHRACRLASVVPVPVRAAVIVPTQARPDYLAVALASLAPQVTAAGARLLVVDDGPGEETRRVTLAHGAEYVAHERPSGLNAARNTGIAAAADADLLVFVDDDVEVRDGWLAALLAAAEELPEEVGVLTGPIRARFEDHRFWRCGREGAPVTELDLGPVDVDAPHAWGANMTVRRSAVERVGAFDESRHLYGDEQEWQDRWRAVGGRIRYVAAAALDHRRAGDDARMRSLMRAAFRRGRASRRFDAFKRTQPSTAQELRVLAGCLLHGPRRLCMNGPVLAAHSAGRVRELLAEWHPRHRAPAAAGTPDFLSGTSGTVGGRRAVLRRHGDRYLDRRTRRRRRALRRRAEAPDAPRRRVLVLGVERPDVANTMAASHAELARSVHDVEVRTAIAGTAGKFENLNRLLAQASLERVDWLLVIDDDVDLPAGFLDVFLLTCEEAGLRLAQPAHRLSSHAAWDVTRRRDRAADWRETTFVEIGPVTAFHRDTFRTLLPFPDLRMGWGLDLHWAAVAAQHGWPIGVVDATPVGHELRPVADTYPRDEAVAEATAFLRTRPYVPRDEVRTVRSGRIPVP